MYLCRKRLSKGFYGLRLATVRESKLNVLKAQEQGKKKERGQNQSATFSNAPSCIGFANVNSHIWVDGAKVLLFPEFCKLSAIFLPHHRQRLRHFALKAKERTPNNSGMRSNQALK